MLTIEIGAFGLRAGRTLRETMLNEHCIDFDGKFVVSYPIIALQFDLIKLNY